MPRETGATPSHEPDVLHRWTARKMPPIILLYVALVFLGFMALARFVFHSPTAIKALAMGAVTSLVTLVPGVINRHEYRLSEAGLDRRLIDAKKPRDFTTVWRWDDLDRVKPIGQGFKYYKTLDEPNPWRRFWKLHVSDAYSGEFRVEARDRASVLALLEARGVPTSPSAAVAG